MFLPRYNKLTGSSYIFEVKDPNRQETIRTNRLTDLPEKDNCAELVYKSLGNYLILITQRPQERMREDNRAKAQISPMIWHLIVSKDKGITTLLP